MKFRIYYDSTDAGGIVYHTEYIKFCERARSEIFFRNGIYFENEGYVVKQLKANFIASAKLADIIDVKTKISSHTKVKIDLIQEIYLNDKKIFELEVTVVYVKNGKIAKIPDSHIKVINAYES